jgi:hypothetical protein
MTSPGRKRKQRETTRNDVDHTSSRASSPPELLSHAGKTTTRTYHVTIDSPSTSSSSLVRSALTGSTSSTRPTSSPQHIHRHRPSGWIHCDHRPAGGRAGRRPKGPCVEVRTIPCPRPVTNRKTSKCDTRNRPRPNISSTFLFIFLAAD